MLTEEQTMISDMAASFAADRLRPNAAKWDEEHCLDRDVLRELGDLGFGGIYVSEEVGGSALGRLDAALIFEKLSMGDVSHAAFMSIHNMATWMTDKFGEEDMRRKWVPKLAAADLIISYCLTEPGAGSPRSDRKSADGFVTSVNPRPVISKTPIS